MTSSGLKTCAEHLYVILHTRRTLPLGEALTVKPKLSQIPGLFYSNRHIGIDIQELMNISSNPPS